MVVVVEKILTKDSFEIKMIVSSFSRLSLVFFHTHLFSPTAGIDALDLLTTSTFDKDVLMVLGIVVLVCISPSIIAWLVSIAEVSAAGTSTVAVGGSSDGGTHGKEYDLYDKRRTSSKRHWLPPRRNIATSVRWVLRAAGVEHHG